MLWAATSRPLDDREDRTPQAPFSCPVNSDDVAITDPDIAKAVALHTPPKCGGGVPHDPGDWVDLGFEVITCWRWKSSTGARQKQ